MQLRKPTSTRELCMKQVASKKKMRVSKVCMTLGKWLLLMIQPMSA